MLIVDSVVAFILIIFLLFNLFLNSVSLFSASIVL